MLGLDPSSSAPGSKLQAGKIGTPVGRRLLRVPTLSSSHSGSQLRPGWQHQLVLDSQSPDKTTQLQLPRMLAMVSQRAQHAQQLLSRTRQALKAAIVKLADCATTASQHAPQHAKQLLSRSTQVWKAAVSSLVDFAAAAAPQRAQQLLSRTKHAVTAAVAKHADHVAAVCNSAHHQGAQLLGSFGDALHRRALAAGTPDSVDVEVTVNVPSGQAGSATQDRIEGPSFGPALQQSLSNAGMLSLRSSVFGVRKQMSCPYLSWKQACKGIRQL